MLKVVNGEAPKTRKLILGFDAGCGTCADLAAGVQEKVGDKLEVQNLNDPQLLAWREEALGKDAKWTPTLFEVEGEKVLKAWAGWRMGYALSRKLGPSSTWQVMQALGEVGGTPRVEESSIVEKLPEKTAEAVVGISRSQFIKGVGGAAVAASVLSSGVLFPSTAEAMESIQQSTGTLNQRKLARTIVRSSGMFKKLENEQRRISGAPIGQRYWFTMNTVKVYGIGKYAAVTAYSVHSRRVVSAAFTVDLRLKRLVMCSHMVLTTTQSSWIKVRVFDNCKPVPRNSQLLMSARYIKLSSGKIMTYDQFINANKKRLAQRTPQGPGIYDDIFRSYNECVPGAEKLCVGGKDVSCANFPKIANQLLDLPQRGKDVLRLARIVRKFTPYSYACDPILGAVFEGSGFCASFARTACYESFYSSRPPSGRPAPPIGAC